MKLEPLFRVLACIDLSAEAGRQKLGGIYRFLSAGYAWELSLIRSQKEFDETFRERVKAQTFDGFLIAVPEKADMRTLHADLGKPTVFIDYYDRPFARSFKDCVFIHDDDAEIGRLAARNLLAQGPFNSYGYAASSDRRPWNRNRAEQFARALSQRRITPFRLEDTDNLPLADVAAWLKTLPLPAGILAAYDDTARRVLDACHAAGLHVPKDVSVLGIGNDELICQHASPPLSSLILDFEEEGYRAARELQALMMRKRRPTRGEIACGCRGVARRGSTAGERSAGSLVQQAVAFIRENAFKGIGAEEVVGQLHVSRRLADLRFREVTGTSILAYITDLRLAEVKRLLKESDLRIGEIARQCGYAAPSLKNIFARHVGCSMREFRRRHARRDPTQPFRG